MVQIVKVEKKNDSEKKEKNKREKAS